MFINLTHEDGRALINVDHIVAIVQENEEVSIVVRDRLDPLVVQETYDEIVDRIEQGRSKVW